MMQILVHWFKSIHIFEAKQWNNVWDLLRNQLRLYRVNVYISFESSLKHRSIEFIIKIYNININRCTHTHTPTVSHTYIIIYSFVSISQVLVRFQFNVWTKMNLAQFTWIHFRLCIEKPIYRHEHTLWFWSHLYSMYDTQYWASYVHTLPWLCASLSIKLDCPKLHSVFYPMNSIDGLECGSKMVADILFWSVSKL